MAEAQATTEAEPKGAGPSIEAPSDSTPETHTATEAASTENTAQTEVESPGAEGPAEAGLNEATPLPTESSEPEPKATRKFPSRTKDILCCDICLGRANNHRTLPCEHYFCQECLERRVKDDSIVCPECKQVCQLEGKAVMFLPRSQILKDYLRTVCNACMRADRDIFCEHCSQFLCISCHENCRDTIERAVNELIKETHETIIPEPIERNEITEQKEWLEHHFVVADEKIEMHSNKMIKTLQDRQTEVETELQDKKGDDLDRLDGYRQQVANAKARMYKFIDKLTEMKENNNTSKRSNELYKFCKDQTNEIWNEQGRMLGKFKKMDIQFIPQEKETFGDLVAKDVALDHVHVRRPPTPDKSEWTLYEGPY